MSEPIGTTARHVRTLFDDGATAGLTDGQLLERFASRTGEAAEAAFEAIVERLGAMVLHACRGLLRDENDARDAFQATLLTLVRRAGSLWVEDSIGPWLHRVACRAAGKVWRESTGHRRRERRAAEAEGSGGVDVAERRDLAAAIHEEVDRLPGRFRAAVVLCDLEGRSYEEAARQIGCGVGTVKSRLARGRGRLRDRLVRRGLAPASGAILGAEVASAPVLAGWVASATRAAVRAGVSQGVGLGSTAAWSREGRFYAMQHRAILGAGGLIAAVGLAGALVLTTRGATGQQETKARPGAPASPKANAAQVPDDPPVPKDDRAVVRPVIMVLNPSIPNLSDVRIAGFGEEDRPEALTWERIYKLALVRARSRPPAAGGAGARSLDPARLDEEAKRVDFADFARFRRDFLAGREADGSGFRDPSGDVFELLRLAQGVEDAAKGVAAIEGLYKVALEMAKREFSRRKQIEVDRIDDALQRARADQLDKRQRFRDGLGALKAELGLSPGAPVYLDRSSLAAFREVFDEATKSVTSTERDYARLDAIFTGLPVLEDVVIEGRSLLADVKRDSDRDEDFLKAATSLAIRNRDARGGARSPGDSDDALTLRVREGVRAIRESSLFYWLEGRRFTLLIRSRDHAQEQLLDPPPGTLDLGTDQIRDLVGLQDQTPANRDRLVALWTSYQARRLALARDLGILPADDWNTFLGQLAARKGEAGR